LILYRLRWPSLADWNYIAGTDKFNQDFALIDAGDVGGQFNGSDIDAADITILNSDLSAVSPPITNKTMAILTNNPLTLRYVINLSDNNIPQTPASYLAFIRLRDTVLGTIRKTFEIDLRVFLGG